MPTEKIFWQDPYKTRCESVVTGVLGDRVTLDRTVAFARSGGQASDDGAIAGLPILEARKREREIDYLLPAGHGLQRGDVVEVEVDWERRYRLMRLHSACEIVLAVVTRLLPSAEKTGANIAPDKARIDFAYDGNVAESIDAIAHELEGLIKADKPIFCGFADERNETRFWEIDGFARVPCGGTHPAATGEIGRVRLKRANPGRGKERIEIYIAEDEDSA